MLVAKKEYKDYSYNEQLDENIKRKKVIVKRKSNTKIKLKIFSFTLILLLFGISILGRYAYIAQNSTDISRYEKEIQKLVKEKETLEVELYKIAQSQWIESEAREKLNMDFPRSDQRVYINVSSKIAKDDIEIDDNSNKLAFLNPFKGVIDKVIKVF